jgi:thioredoxin-related protein
MKSVLSLLFFLVFMLSNAQINWMSMEQAIEAQKKNPKKIIIDFYTENNNASQLMERQTFSHPFLIKFINDKFYAVKFNAVGKIEVNFYGRVFKNPDISVDTPNKISWHPFAKFMNVNSSPSLVFLDENGQTITNLMGSFSVVELEPYLTMIGNNEYKDIKTREQWENYQKKFKSKIKE